MTTWKDHTLGWWFSSPYMRSPRMQLAVLVILGFTAVPLIVFYAAGCVAYFMGDTP